MKHALVTIIKQRNFMWYICRREEDAIVLERGPSDRSRNDGLTLTGAGASTLAVVLCLRSTARRRTGANEVRCRNDDRRRVN